MPKLIMLTGLPASGKSTWAKETLKGGGDFVRVSKDDIRPMMHEKWTFKNEKFTMRAEEAIVETMLLMGKNVIVDDTNLGEKHLERWKNIASECDARFEVKKFDVDYTECIIRNMNRDKDVPTQAIINMALQYHMMDIYKPIIIVDLDGTVANLKHRLKYIQNENPEDNDYRAFYDCVIDDEPIKSTIDMVNQFYKDGYEICFVSGRSDESREQTEEWLSIHIPEVDYKALIMREAGDRRPDTDVKRGFYKRFFKDYEVKHVIDDRPSVIRMWREEGLDVIDVGDGVEF